MRRLRLLLSAAAAGLLLAAGPARAQGPTNGSWEFTAGAGYVGGFDAGSRAAELTPNSGPSGSVTLFETESRVRPAGGLLAKIGIFITPAFALEGGLRYTRPTYEVQITDDFEDAEDQTSEETLSQYLFDVSAVWHFRGSGGSRTTPFVYGGGGYLRELHEGDALVEDGLEFHAGGGVKWWLGSAGRWGFRADAGISIRDGGFDPEEKRRLVPQASGSLIWVF
jgi:hypothetical protein